jgi:hypothetical protein
METVPRPGRDVPPKNDKLQAKRKVEAQNGEFSAAGSWVGA